MHASATLLTLLPLLAPSLAATSLGFSMIAAHSASPIHLQELIASGFHFYIGGGATTATYCPSPPVPDCSSFSSNTLLSCQDQTGASTGCGMDVAVPGGQQVYVDPATGALGYTMAHSALLPVGALTSGFEYDATGNSASIGTFAFSGAGATGFVACPVEGDNGVGEYQVFANVDGKVLTGCIGMDVLTSATNNTAWQYV